MQSTDAAGQKELFKISDPPKDVDVTHSYQTLSIETADSSQIFRYPKGSAWCAANQKLTKYWR